MEPVIATSWGTVKDIMRDPWAVDLATAEQAVTGVVDLIYKNREFCEIERVGDDVKGWCLENPDECVLHFDIEDKLIDNALPLAAKVLDMIKLAMQDDSCFSDAEQIGELYQLTEDFGEIAAYLSGFDYKWDKSIERTHIRRAMFKKEIKAAVAAIPRTNAFEEQWPELSKLVGDLVHDFLESMKPTKAQLAHMEAWKKPVHMPHFELPQLPDFKSLFHLPSFTKHHENQEHHVPAHKPFEMFNGFFSHHNRGHHDQHMKQFDLFGMKF